MPEKKPSAGKRSKRANVPGAQAELIAPVVVLTNQYDLTPQEESFVALLAKGETQRAAYLKVFPKAHGWTLKTVDERASRLARSDKVQARFSGILAAAAKANDIDVAFVLGEYLLRLRADPRELTEVRVCPCRFCYGVGHLYQRTDGELARDCVRHKDKRQDRLARELPDPGPMDEQGGGGYSRLLAPNRECPACAGAGEPHIVLKDSRTYSAGALTIFGGVKETKEGIEVKIGDRDNALLQLARHLGFFEADNKLDVDATVDAAALDVIYERAMAKSKADAVQARGRMARIAGQVQPGSVSD